MTTVADIVTRAFRKLSVAADDEPLTADQMQAGVDAYNDMIHAWKPRGVDFRHIDQTSTEQFLLGEEWREGTVYLLAEKLSSDYTVPPSFNATEWFNDLRRCFTDTPEVSMPTALVRMPSRYWRNARIR